MAKYGYSDVVTITATYKNSTGRTYFDSALTENHVCIDDPLTLFDENGGFVWETHEGNVYIRTFLFENVTGTVNVHFGIPINT